MPRPQRLFPAPLKRTTTFIVRRSSDGYVALTVVHAGTGRLTTTRDYYERLTTGESLDVIEATIGTEFGL